MSEIRKIIHIDEEKCNGCGLCVPSCAEGALKIINGKARLISDRFCDGLGNCLGECPQDAIRIIEREAELFDEAAVTEHLQTGNSIEIPALACGCPGSMERDFRRMETNTNPIENGASHKAEVLMQPELGHWPIQLRLVNPRAGFLQGQDLLISADCVPFAYPDYHRKLLKGKSLLIGCPKLDDTAIYHDKLVEIFKHNQIKSITLAYMEVPCCFGLNRLVRTALKEAGREDIKVEEAVIGVDGKKR